MKKILIFILIIFHLCLWTVFVFNQFGIGTVWAAKEKEAQEIKKSTAVAVTEVEKSTTTKTTKEQKKEEKKLKRPKGISDLEWEKLKAKRPLPFDKGPDKIDVSKYPKEMQEIYKNDFKKKCSKCHTIARPINAPYVLPGTWRRYIKKMMKKPSSGINPIAAKKIYKFLAYDSKIRKKELYEKKLKEKQEAEKAKAESAKKKSKKK